MFVGEAPGEEEAIQGKPFVGKSGQLLQQMLDAAGITRDKMYITNAVVWRPPLNRTPLPAEIQEMAPYQVLFQLLFFYLLLTWLQNIFPSFSSLFSKK